MSTLTREQLEFLGLAERGRPDLYLSAEDVTGAPHAAAMRLAFEALGLDGFLCVEGSPTVAFLVVQDPEGLDELQRVHKALWNQGLASLLLVIHPQTIRAYSLMRKPVAEGWQPDGGTPDPRLVKTLDLTARGLEVLNLVTAVETGRFFNENPAAFDRGSRVDRVLLSNLIETRRLLIEKRLDREKLQPRQARAQAQALLLQIMFLAYLEDRDFVDEEIFANGTGGTITSLTALLDSGDPDLVHQLFATLRRSFNGDLFLAPCAFEDVPLEGSLHVEDLEVLAVFRPGPGRDGHRPGAFLALRLSLHPGGVDQRRLRPILGRGSHAAASLRRLLHASCVG